MGSSCHGEEPFGIRQDIKTKASYKLLNLKVEKLWTSHVETFTVLPWTVREKFTPGAEEEVRRTKVN